MDQEAGAEAETMEGHYLLVRSPASLTLLSHATRDPLGLEIPIVGWAHPGQSLMKNMLPGLFTDQSSEGNFSAEVPSSKMTLNHN